MIFKYLSVSLILFALSMPMAQASRHWPVSVVEVMDNAKFVLFLKDEDIAAIPPWQPGRGEPPLRLGQAIARVQAYIAKNPLLAQAKIVEIEFKPIRKHEKENRWYYLFEIRFPRSSGTTPAKHFLAVLPNGKVVETVIEPRY